LRFSVRKTSKDKSLPVPKKDLALVYADEIVSMPEVSERGILATNDIQLQNGADFYELYLTPATQKNSVDIEGDMGAKGWMPTVSGNFPGTRLTISEWMHNNLNEGFVVIQKNCGNNWKIIGTKLNPLFLTGKISEDKDSGLCEITLKAVKKSKRPYILYNYEETGAEQPGGGSAGDCDCAPLIDIIG
jgi:hypothetical protein